MLPAGRRRDRVDRNDDPGTPGIPRQFLGHDNVIPGSEIVAGYYCLCRQVIDPHMHVGWRARSGRLKYLCTSGRKNYGYLRSGRLKYPEVLLIVCKNYGYLPEAGGALQ